MVKNYKVMFSPSFIKMLEDELNKCMSYISTYARQIEKKVYEAINLLKIFPYATPSINFRHFIPICIEFLDQFEEYTR